MSATCVPWYMPHGNMGLSKHGDPVFPHFCHLNQNLAGVRAGGGEVPLSQRQESSRRSQQQPIKGPNHRIDFDFGAVALSGYTSPSHVPAGCARTPWGPCPETPPASDDPVPRSVQCWTSASELLSCTDDLRIAVRGYRIPEQMCGTLSQRRQQQHSFDASAHQQPVGAPWGRTEGFCCAVGVEPPPSPPSALVQWRVQLLFANLSENCASSLQCRRLQRILCAPWRFTMVLCFFIWPLLASAVVGYCCSWD